MSAIFGFLLILLVIVLVTVFSIIGGILRLFFGFGRKQTFRSNRRENQSAYERDNNRVQEEDTASARKKIFDDDDGEYIDFEEVKNDDKK